jgi:ADP-dependent glucokinase
MALRFAKEGAKVLLAAKMTEKMRKDLHESITLAGSDHVERDDIHLILEYKRQESWGKYTSPRANRWDIMTYRHK